MTVLFIQDKMVRALLVAGALFAGCEVDGASAVSDADLTADSGMQAPPPGRARVVLPPGPFCVGSPQDILRPDSGVPSLMTTEPTLSVTYRKCNNTPFTVDRNCQIRVGTYEPWGAVRTNFIWPQGATRFTVEFTVWPPGDFPAAPIGDRKELYITCDDGVNPGYWRQEGVLAVVKR